MTFIAVITGFALFFITMSVGVMMGRKPIAGSCGGLANVGLNGECKVCGRTPGSCDENGDAAPKSPNAALNSLFVDAMASDVDEEEDDERPIRRRPVDPLNF